MAKRKSSSASKRSKPVGKIVPAKRSARKETKLNGTVSTRALATVAGKKIKSAKPGSVRATLPKPGAAVNGDSEVRPVQMRKTPLSAAELEEFRALLMEKRRELMGDVANLENEAMNKGSSGETSGSSSMPIHMADLGTDTWEQELTLGLIENERGLLREIDDALDRIQEKTYGICMATNRPISKARLRAKPWAKYCIEYARKQERGLG